MDLTLEGFSLACNVKISLQKNEPNVDGSSTVVSPAVSYHPRNKNLEI